MSDQLEDGSALPDATKFWSKVDIRADDGCWLWRGSIGVNGYGRLSEGGKWRPASRVALELKLGRRLARKEHACHTCDNPPCVRPSHLWVGSPAENSRDSVRKGRWGAQQATHCPRGHPYSGPNLIVDGKGLRHCRTCRQAKDRKGWQRRKARAAAVKGAGS